MADKHSEKNNKGKTGSNANVPKKKPGLLIYVPAFCSLIGTLMLLVVIAAALPLTVPNFMGYDVYNVVSGSMEPTIPIGSIIYVKDTDPADIKSGDIIAFKSGDSVIMHRVKENKVVEGTFVTKGDANEAEDMNNVPYDVLIGIVVRHIPILGQLMILFGSTLGRLCMICFAACGAILNILSSRFSDAIEDEAIEESIREKELAEIQNRIAQSGKQPDPEPVNKKDKEPEQHPDKKSGDQPEEQSGDQLDKEPGQQPEEDSVKKET